MGLYLFCLCVGFGGLLVMAILGHAHVPGHHSHGSSHAHGHVVHPVTGSHHGLHGHDVGIGGKALAQAWLSPRVLFSLIVALAAAWLFERWLIQPLWRVLFGFASLPARTLESVVLDEAQAVTNFDKRGHGLIALDLDGQVVQILGVLHEEERKFGVRIRAGDRVSITAVDTKRNCCTVTRLPTPPAARETNASATP